ADPCEDDACGPGFLQQRWQPSRVPDGQHALGVATPDVDHILRQYVCPEVWGPAKQWQVRGATGEPCKRRVEAHNGGVGVPAGRRHKGKGRLWRACLCQHVPVQRQVLWFHREASTAQCNDLPWMLWHCSSLRYTCIGYADSIGFRGW